MDKHAVVIAEGWVEAQSKLEEVYKYDYDSVIKVISIEQMASDTLPLTHIY